ncbi:hypothetical protein WJX73_004846 [Symbiochloris irregularis]|uniref:Apple domain-containing protein n=1 Tax=Symbiochloris irregularis TaxID=706552 RepID=A0AAW1PEU4_9CHLO
MKAFGTWGALCLLSLLARQTCAQSGGPSANSYASAPSAPYEEAAAPSSVSPTALYFQQPITFDPSTVFVGNGGCSPSASSDYLQIAPFIVPAVEAQHVAMRWYQAQPSAGATAPLASLTYFDLENGLLVTASTTQLPTSPGGTVPSFGTQATFYNYTILVPIASSLAAYNATISQLLTSAEGLLNGGGSSNPCAPADPQVQSAYNYLSYVSKNISTIKAPSSNLTAGEIKLASGCIEELSANYEGSDVSDVITNGTFITADVCCQKCKANPQCNIFVYCPSFTGCPYGSGQIFPYQGCQLKNQPGLQLGPNAVPLAYERGHTTLFASGRLPA